MQEVLVFAYSDINFDARIKKQCEALCDAGCSVSFYGVSYKSEGGQRTRWTTRSFGSRPATSILQYLHYALLVVIFFFIQIPHLASKPVIIVHNMPNFLVLPFFVARAFGATVILDLHDDSVLAYQKYFKSGPLYCAFKALEENISLKVPNKLLTANRLLEDSLKAICSKSILVIHNAPAGPAISEAKSYKLGSELRLVYLGHLGSHYDLKTIISLANQNVLVKSLDIYGDGVQRALLEDFVKDINAAKKVSFHGRYFADDIPEILQDYDLGVAFYESSAFSNTLLPVKILEYTNNGLAVLVNPIKPLGVYFSEDSLLYVESQSDFDSIVNDIVTGSINPSEIQRQAALDIRPISWTIEKELFVNYVLSKPH